ncbi:CheR family methyltransferase [Thalassotalea ganghwensis]
MELDGASIRGEQSQLSQEDFKFLCDFVYQVAGIVLNDSKREMVYRRLTRILRERKFNSFSEYCQLLRQKPEQEKDYFINAITTNLTSFFRENHHFDYLRDHELPNLINVKKAKRIRIWSSASSTGEEPYSIAIILVQALAKRLSAIDAKILATDIDSNVLSVGKLGIYDEKRIDGLPEVVRREFFKQGSGENLKKVRVNPVLQKLITFKQLNLLHEWPMKGPFDVIFCRNVIIYFDKKTQLDLFERYYQLLAPGGLLILGHSESLGAYQKYFENVGRTIFRKPLHSLSAGNGVLV